MRPGHDESAIYELDTELDTRPQNLYNMQRDSNTKRKHPKKHERGQVGYSWTDQKGFKHTIVSSRVLPSVDDDEDIYFDNSDDLAAMSTDVEFEAWMKKLVAKSQKHLTATCLVQYINDIKADIRRGKTTSDVGCAAHELLDVNDNVLGVKLGTHKEALLSACTLFPSNTLNAKSMRKYLTTRQRIATFTAVIDALQNYRLDRGNRLATDEEVNGHRKRMQSQYDRQADAHRAQLVKKIRQGGLLELKRKRKARRRFVQKQLAFLRGETNEPALGAAGTSDIVWHGFCKLDQGSHKYHIDRSPEMQEVYTSRLKSYASLDDFQPENEHLYCRDETQLDYLESAALR